MRKIITSGFIVLSFLISSIVPITSSYEISKNKIYVDYTDISSIHINITEPKYWYAIKMETNTTVNISIYNNYYLSTMNDTSNVRGYFDYLYIFDKEQNFFMYGGTYGSYDIPGDRYFQIDFGSINYSHYNFGNSTGRTLKGTGLGNFSRRSGTWYFLFMGYSAEGYNDIYFNTSKPVNISTTQGTNTFFYQREDFHGKLNIGWNRGTILFNGEKRINVDNNLFAHFEPFTSSGISFTKYINPIGYSQWLFQIGVTGMLFPIFEKTSPGGYWNYDIKNEISGEWIFKTNIFGHNILNFPNILLFGADVKLPD